MHICVRCRFSHCKHGEWRLTKRHVSPVFLSVSNRATRVIAWCCIKVWLMFCAKSKLGPDLPLAGVQVIHAAQRVIHALLALLTQPQHPGQQLHLTCLLPLAQEYLLNQHRYGPVPGNKSLQCDAARVGAGPQLRHVNAKRGSFAPTSTPFSEQAFGSHLTSCLFLDAGA